MPDLLVLIGLVLCQANAMFFGRRIRIVCAVTVISPVSPIKWKDILGD